jgi:hypothetical protein
MNNRNNRGTRAIVASGSLLAIILIGIPWVDEYLRLRREALGAADLEYQLTEVQFRQQQLDHIEGKLKGSLARLLDRSISPSQTESVRESLVELVRRSSGRIRRLEITESGSRGWASDADDPRLDISPTYGEESSFILYSHLVELQADGPLQSVRQILQGVVHQGWLMTTKGLSMAPSGVSEAPVTLELRFVLYGLIPAQAQPEHDLATTPLNHTALR